MQILKSFRNHQEIILQFLDVMGGGMAVLSSNKRARPEFFISAHTFIHEYIEEIFFRKEELLIKALEDNGFPNEEGPILIVRTEQNKSRAAAEHLLNASKGWQAGDEEARGEVSWAAGEFISSTRDHMTHLKNRVFPLLDQNMSPDDEQRIADGLHAIIPENDVQTDTDKYTKLIASLKEELKDWK